MNTLVECWNKLEGNVGELSSWVEAKESTEDAGTSIPIEKLEGQLNQLKVMFAEKQKLVQELEAYGVGKKLEQQEEDAKQKLDLDPASATAADESAETTKQDEDTAAAAVAAAAAAAAAAE